MVVKPSQSGRGGWASQTLPAGGVFSVDTKNIIPGRQFLLRGEGSHCQLTWRAGRPLRAPAPRPLSALYVLVGAWLWRAGLGLASRSGDRSPWVLARGGGVGGAGVQVWCAPECGGSMGGGCAAGGGDLTRPLLASQYRSSGHTRRTSSPHRSHHQVRRRLVSCHTCTPPGDQRRPPRLTPARPL